MSRAGWLAAWNAECSTGDWRVPTASGSAGRYEDAARSFDEAIAVETRKGNLAYVRQIRRLAGSMP
jgi:hypothetical protein